MEGRKEGKMEGWRKGRRNRVMEGRKERGKDGVMDEVIAETFGRGGGGVCSRDCA